MLDFSSETLTGKNLQGLDLTPCTFQKARLENVTFDKCRLMGCDLTHATYRSVVFRETVLTKTKLHTSIFENTAFRGCECTDTAIGLSHFTLTSFERTDLSRVNFGNSNFKESQFSDCVLSLAEFSGNLAGVVFRRCQLRRATFRGTCLDGADVGESDFFECFFQQCSLSGVRNAYSALNLETSRLNQQNSYFDQCERNWQEKWCDWECLRTLGRMPVFTVSSSLLLYLVASIYVIGQYNDKLEVVRGWGEHLKQGNAAARSLGDLILEKVQFFPISWQVDALLTATVMLAIASMLFAIGCPAEVKAYSRAEWVYSLQRSLLHYWPLSWKKRPLRIVCGSLYLIGGVLFLTITSLRLLAAFLYALSYTRI